MPFYHSQSVFHTSGKFCSISFRRSEGKSEVLKESGKLREMVDIYLVWLSQSTPLKRKKNKLAILNIDFCMHTSLCLSLFSLEGEPMILGADPE